MISEFAHLLRPGQNILAVQAINQSATSNDLLVVPALVEGVVYGGSGEIPRRQVGNPQIDFGAIEFNPASGNQNEEYIALVNNQDFAVDISGWRLDGDVQITFQPGTVIPAGWTFYTTPDARAFRARSDGPSGNMQLFVQGNYVRPTGEHGWLDRTDRCRMVRRSAPRRMSGKHPMCSDTCGSVR